MDTEMNLAALLGKTVRVTDAGEYEVGAEGGFEGILGRSGDHYAVRNKGHAWYINLPHHVELVEEAPEPLSSVEPEVTPEEDEAFDELSNTEGCWTVSSSLEDFPPHDPVNHPSHYTSHPSGIECIQITQHMNFCTGNAMKYLWRAGLKEDAVEDLQKARFYIDQEISRIEGGPQSW